MFRKLFPLMGIGLCGVIVLHTFNSATARTPLTKAEIQDIQNLVQLMPRNLPKRQARKWDAMIPGDKLSTGRASLADLRFNDGSVARIGEQALFRFLPKTRNFKLSTGTVLLLIPPGRGQTNINTPNAAAAIRGSALFVRYNKESDTTVVGALTNSGIQVFNKNASQNHLLHAGQLMVIVKGQFQGLYDFDLRTFYQTSDLVRGFNLGEHSIPSPDPAIAQVQAETAAAVKAQLPLKGKGVVENPSFLRKQSPSLPNFPNQETTKNVSPTQTLLETGEIQTNRKDTTTNPSSTTTTNPPTTTTNPPTTTTNPPTTTTNPPTTTTNPPTTITNPPTTTTNPPTTTTNPPTTTTNPPTTITNPPTTITNPPTTITNPPTTITKPPTATTNPVPTRQEDDKGRGDNRRPTLIPTSGAIRPTTAIKIFPSKAS
ncbi:FecR family protein [Aetokthonos hydrillicola Thurmond2011]|uniref:FecR family protein n=1 Tax=Aetokthonos hydrillicola Thurmond2011 TaxID=2712845 RepID=A0AAP5I6D9_9CYAN|nr:FecR family protein [Aetokthonos hydrillicola]MBW4586804.1 FecR family protein [Aetokthonos hydrillicola CCALA 1050]MDR9895837.1 FecR family protein [Aetokthonos hydrillicola Thurmond2011]